MSYLDVVRFNPTAGGTVDFVFSSIVTGYQSPATAGAQDQALYYYRAESNDLSQWEVGIGTYTVSTATLARTTVLFNNLGTTAKINFSAAPQVAIVLLAEGLRTILAADTTFYVRTDGSDSNSGLVNSAGGAWLTIQHAMNVLAANYDFGSKHVTVQVGAGTYTAGVSVIPWIGGGTLTFLGDATTPSNVLISVSAAGGTAGCCFYIASGALPGFLTINGFKLTTSVSAGSAIYGSAGSFIIPANIDFSTTALSHFYMQSGAYCDYVNNYTISGGATRHLQCNSGGFIQNPGNVATTITISSTVTFSQAFAFSQLAGSIQTTNSSFVNSSNVAGSRYLAQTNGVIVTGSGSSTYFPGTSDGTTATGGQYT